MVKGGAAQVRRKFFNMPVEEKSKKKVERTRETCAWPDVSPSHELCKWCKYEEECKLSAITQ